MCPPSTRRTWADGGRAWARSMPLFGSISACGSSTRFGSICEKKKKFCLECLLYFTFLVNQKFCEIFEKDCRYESGEMDALQFWRFSAKSVIFKNFGTFT